MAYIAPIHRSSSVRHALHMKLFSATEESIIVAKANRIEVWQISSDNNQMYLFHSQRIFGTITVLQTLRPIDTDTELLFVGTDRFQYFTLEWDMDLQTLRTVDTVQDVDEKHLRDSQSQDRCLVDPSGRFMALLLWEGVLSVLRLQTRRERSRPDYTRHLVSMDQVRLTELFIKSWAFLHSETGQPKIAFLYQSQADRADAKLSSYRLTAGDRNADTGRFDAHKDREIDLDIDDPGAALLIPVEKVEDEKRHNVRNTASATANLGGLLVVGETRVLYIDDTTHRTVEAPLRSASIFIAWAPYDTTHYLLADEYGTLHLLTIIVKGVVVESLDISAIGKTSRASCLVYIASRGLLFVGSHNGDSQLFRVALNPDAVRIDEIQLLRNIAPVLDFAIMDMGNREDDQQLTNEYSSGQARIVTASGVHKDGSLRSIRSGVGLEDIGILGDLGSARGLFSLKSARLTADPDRSPTAVDALVVSFPIDTRVFLFSDDGEIEEVEQFPGLVLDKPTLLARNLPQGVLQVTEGAVTISNVQSGETVSSWTPPPEKTITSASANGHWVLLSIEGTQLASLSIDKGLAMAAEKEIGATDQIACLHAALQLDNVGVVGLWSSGTVSIVDLSTLEQKHSGVSLRRKEDNASIPRSMVLAQVLAPSVAGPTLFVAMDDGNVVSFSVSAADLALSARKSVVLGTRQARLHPLAQPNGTYNIFATTEHPSLIYGSEGRITYAAVTAEDANFVCPFDAAAFPGAIAVATDTQVKLSRTDTTKQTHIRMVEMNETVRRIAYSPVERMFVLGCIRRELVQGREEVTSSVKLIDEVLFQQVSAPLDLADGGTEMVECIVRAQLQDMHGNAVERFVVGTSFLDGAAEAAEGGGGAAAAAMAGASVADKDRVQGRVLVLGVDNRHALFQVSAHRMRGPCRALAVLDGGLLVLGLSKTVVVSRYTETSSMSGQLSKLVAYRTATYVVDLAVQGNMIAVGDLMKSTALVEFVPGEPARLEERARNYQANWVTATGHVDGEAWLEADGFGNLSVLERNTQGVTDDDKRRLTATSELNLGEMVNRIRPVVVQASAGALVHPRAFVATVEGSLYMFGTVAAEAQDLLMTLQTKIAGVVRGPGNTSFMSYRGFHNNEREAGEPFRFVDGELLEYFLDFDEDVQQTVAEGLGPSVEDLRNMIEELKRMH